MTTTTDQNQEQEVPVADQADKNSNEYRLFDGLKELVRELLYDTLCLMILSF